MLKKNTSMESQIAFTLIVSSLIFLIYFIFKKRSSKALNLPPSPPKLPLIGNIHQLAGKLPHRGLRDLATKHGPIMKLELGQVSTVAVSSPRLAKEILKTHDTIFANRPKTLATQILYYKATSIAVSSYGAYWRQMKKIATLEVFSAKKVKSFSLIRTEELNRVIETIKTYRGSPFDFSELVVEMTNNIICRAALGNNVKEQATLLHLIDELMVALSAFNVAEFFPRLGFLNVVTGTRSSVLKLHRNLDKILQQVVDDHIVRRRSDERSEEEDLVDVLLRVKEEGELEFPITYDNIKAIILDMFAAGTDTSSTTLEWAMAEMMKNPRVMKKAQTEVREVFEGKTTITETDTQGLNYLKLVIKETLRLHPPVPLLLPRESTQHCQIDGYDIPEKTKIIINAFACATDPKYWEDPESFVPERFENNSMNFMGTDYEFIPFGAGRRMCPGISFGLVSIEYPLAEFLYRFNWELLDGLKPKDLVLSEGGGIAIRLKHHLHLTATSIKI